MASVKNIKKDIDLVMSLVINDCLFVLDKNEKVDGEKVFNIIGEVIAKHRELRVRANHPDGKDNPKIVKQHYQKLVDDMLDSADKALDKLSAEVKRTI